MMILEPLDPFQNLVLWTVLVTGAVTDLRKGLIYNWLTLPGIVTGLVLAVICNGVPGFVGSLAGILIGGGLCALGFYFGFLGGGDVKQMAVVGAVAGPVFVFETMIMSILAGGIIGFVLLACRGGLWKVLNWYYHILKTFFFRMQGVELAFPPPPRTGSFAFGVCILFGALFSYYYDLNPWR